MPSKCMLGAHRDEAVPGGLERRDVDQVGQVGAAEAGRPPRNHLRASVQRKLPSLEQLCSARLASKWSARLVKTSARQSAPAENSPLSSEAFLITCVGFL